MTDLSNFLRGLTRRMATQSLVELSDQALVDRVVGEQDQAALEAILQRHGAMVYRVCWRVLRHDQDAEDAFQAAFLVLAQNLGRLRKRTSLASWLHGAALRVARKAKVAAVRRRRHELAARSCPSAPAVAWDVLDAELAKLASSAVSGHLSG